VAGSRAAQSRHPRAGYGTGFSRGRGYRSGYRYCGYRRGDYGRYRYSRYSRYRSYPYYGGYAYDPYGWPALGLSFYYGGGYPYVGGYSAPYDVGYVSDEPYAGDGGEPDEEYSDRREPLVDEPPDGAELRLVVLPADASVWIDGEFRGAAREVGRLALPVGRHQVEVVRPGFRTVTQEVEVRPDATSSLRIELQRP
jgi:hypothetical protein